MTLVFGQSAQVFINFSAAQNDPSAFEDEVQTLVLYFVYLFVGRFIIGYIATLCICTAAARTTSALKKAFLESLLRKEIAHFDLEGNGSAAAQVTTSTYISGPSSNRHWGRLTVEQMEIKSTRGLLRNSIP